VHTYIQFVWEEKIKLTTSIGHNYFYYLYVTNMCIFASCHNTYLTNYRHMYIFMYACVNINAHCTVFKCYCLTVNRRCVYVMCAMCELRIRPLGHTHWINSTLNAAKQQQNSNNNKNNNNKTNNKLHLQASSSSTSTFTLTSTTSLTICRLRESLLNFRLRLQISIQRWRTIAREHKLYKCTYVHTQAYIIDFIYIYIYV